MASELVFINTSRPEDARSIVKRKAVRSQAARDPSLAAIRKEGCKKRRRYRKLQSFQLHLFPNGLEASAPVPFPPNKPIVPILEPNFPVEDVRTIQGTPRQSTEEDFENAEVEPSSSLILQNTPGGGWAHPFVPYPSKSFMPGLITHCESWPFRVLSLTQIMLSILKFRMTHLSCWSIT